MRYRVFFDSEQIQLFTIHTTCVLFYFHFANAFQVHLYQSNSSFYSSQWVRYGKQKRYNVEGNLVLIYICMRKSLNRSSVINVWFAFNILYRLHYPSTYFLNFPPTIIMVRFVTSSYYYFYLLSDQFFPRPLKRRKCRRYERRGCVRSDVCHQARLDRV